MVTIYTASLTLSNSTFCPHTLYLCVLCGSENKQRLFPYTTLTGWFLQQRFNPLKPSGHYMYRQFNIQQFYVLPTHTVFMCFVWIWAQTAIISLYSINWLVFITGGVCLLRGMDWKFLCIIQVKFYLQRPWHGSGSSSPSPHLGGPCSIPGQSMCDVRWTEWHWDRFLSQYFGFPPSLSFHQYSTLIFVYVLFLAKGQSGEAWELQKAMPFRMSRSFG